MKAVVTAVHFGSTRKLKCPHCGESFAAMFLVVILAIALPVVAFVIALFPGVFEETGRFVALRRF